MKKLFIKNFKIKILFLFLTAFIIPIIAFVILNYFDVLNYEDMIVGEINKDNAENQREVFEYWIRNKELDLKDRSAILEHYIYFNGINKGINNILDEIVMNDKDILTAYYTSENGEDYLNGNQEAVVDGREREWYTKALKSDISTSEPYVDVLTGELVVTFSKTVKNLDGTTNGVLGIDVLFSNIIDKFFKIFDDGVMNIAIFDKNDKIIFSTADDFYEVKDDFDFVEYIESINIKLVLIKEEEDDNLKIIVLLIFVSVISIILIFEATKTLNEPIELLEKNITEIVKNGSKNVEFLGYKDLDDILNLFIEMNKYIEKNIKSIETMRVDLDERNKTLSRLNIEYEKAYKELEIFSLELSNKEREYENLVENIMDYIWIIDLNGKISYANEKLLSKLGYESFEILEKDFSCIVFDFKKNPDFYKILFTRDYDSIDIKFISKNNESQILTSSKTKRIYRDGKIISVQGISRDITNEKKMEKELSVKNKDLILINKISKEMAISNNLNNILNLILKEIRSLMDIEVSTIRIVNDECLNLKAFSGDKNKLIFSDDSLEAMNSHVGCSVKNKEVFIINGIEDIKEKDDYKIIESVKEGNKFAIIPLISGTNEIGALSLITRKRIDKRIESVLIAFANSAAISVEKALLYERLEINYMQTIKALVSAMEAKNALMQGHSHRVSVMSRVIAKKLYLNESEIRDIHMAALLHDIGKIGIKDSIIKSTHWMDMEKGDLIKLHVEIGKKILTPIKLNKTILDGVYYHHKRYDGSGYPYDKVNTPLSAQIIGIADKLDELLSNDEDFTLEEIKNYFNRERGKKFSNEMVSIINEIISSKDRDFIEAYDFKIR